MMICPQRSRDERSDIRDFDDFRQTPHIAFAHAGCSLNQFEAIML
jgi:hypothetical protein